MLHLLQGIAPYFYHPGPFDPLTPSSLQFFLPVVYGSCGFPCGAGGWCKFQCWEPEKFRQQSGCLCLDRVGMAGSCVVYILCFHFMFFACHVCANDFFLSLSATGRGLVAGGSAVLGPYVAGFPVA